MLKFITILAIVDLGLYSVQAGKPNETWSGSPW